MRNTKTTFSALSLALALTVSLGACGQVTGSETSSPSTGTNRPAETTAPEDMTEEDMTEAEAEDQLAAEPEPSLTGTDPGILELGKSFTYSDGLQVTIGKATPVSTSYGPAVSFDITVVNGMDHKYDPSMDFISAQIANVEGEEVFDTENGYEGAPMTSILPGRESTYKIAFEGSAVKDIVVEYTPGDFEHGALIFTPDGK